MYLLTTAPLLHAEAIESGFIIGTVLAGLDQSKTVHANVDLVCTKRDFLQYCTMRVLQNDVRGAKPIEFATKQLLLITT